MLAEKKSRSLDMGCGVRVAQKFEDGDQEST